MAVYRLTAAFPRDERFGLTTQLRRCSTSIPANLAEGCGRSSDADFGRFCAIATGSASELEYHLLLAKNLDFLSLQDHADLSDRTIEVKRMLTARIQKLKSESPKTPSTVPQSPSGLTAET